MNDNTTPILHQIDMRRVPYRGIYKQIADELGVSRVNARRGVRAGVRRYVRRFLELVNEVERDQRQVNQLLGRGVRNVS